MSSEPRTLEEKMRSVEEGCGFLPGERLLLARAAWPWTL